MIELINDGSDIQTDLREFLFRQHLGDRAEFRLRLGVGEIGTDAQFTNVVGQPDIEAECLGVASHLTKSYLVLVKLNVATPDIEVRCDKDTVANLQRLEKFGADKGVVANLPVHTPFGTETVDPGTAITDREEASALCIAYLGPKASSEVVDG